MSGWRGLLYVIKFLNIYVVVLDRDVMVNDYVIAHGDKGDWWIGLKRNLNDREIPKYMNLWRRYHCSEGTSPQMIGFMLEIKHFGCCLSEILL